MASDFVPTLDALLDGLRVNAGGLVLTFVSKPWGRHLNARTWGELPDGCSILAVRPLNDQYQVADIGGGAALSQRIADVYLWWPDDASLDQPSIFREAAVDAVKAAIRAREKTVGAATFAQVINVQDMTDLLGGPTAMLKFGVIITVRGEVDEVYG